MEPSGPLVPTGAITRLMKKARNRSMTVAALKRRSMFSRTYRAATVMERTIVEFFINLFIVPGRGSSRPFRACIRQLHPKGRRGTMNRLLKNPERPLADARGSHGH